jgi:hypothetical protein
MADLGKLQGETYTSQQDVRWIAQTLRELAPQVRNLGGKLFGGKIEWIRPESNGAFDRFDTDPDFAVNAFFPAAHGYKARNERIGYTIKLSVWDEGDHRLVGIASHASRQADRMQASGARRKLVRMLTEADGSLKPVTQEGQ